MGMIEGESRQAMYHRYRSEEQRRRKRNGAILLLIGLAIYALAGTVAARGDEAAAPLPSISCARSGGVKPPTVRCDATNVTGYSLEWRLYGDSDDAITDFETKKIFRFDAPTQWRLIELRVIADDGRTRRLRAWCRWLGRGVEFRQYGREGE